VSLDRLLRVLREEAEERREEILERARTEAEAIVAEAREEAEERTARHRAEVEGKARARARIEIAQARRRARERVLTARTEALDELFRETGELLSDAASSDAYRELLPRLLRSALAHVAGEDLEVRCSPGLEEVVEAALAETGDGNGEPEGGGRVAADRVSTFEVDPSLAPGFQVTDSDGSLTVDGTLEGALRRLRPRLSVELVSRIEDDGALPTVPETGGRPPAPAETEEEGPGGEP